MLAAVARVAAERLPASQQRPRVPGQPRDPRPRQGHRGSARIHPHTSPPRPAKPMPRAPAAQLRPGEVPAARPALRRGTPRPPRAARPAHRRGSPWPRPQLGGRGRPRPYSSPAPGARLTVDWQPARRWVISAAALSPLPVTGIRSFKSKPGLMFRAKRARKSSKPQEAVFSFSP